MSIRQYTLTNLAGAIIPMLVTLVTVPLYLKALGDVRYGVLSLVWLLLGYFGFMEMGLGKATANYIARLRTDSAKERSVVFWSAIAANMVFGTLAALLLWAIGHRLITVVLKIPPTFQEETLAALPWMAATLPLALVSSVLTGALEGRNKFFTVNSLQVANTIVFQIVPLATALRLSPSLAYVIPTAVISRAAMNIPFFMACILCVPLTSFPSVSTTAVKSLLSYGGWVAATGMLIPIFETVDRFLVGTILGAQSVTYYTIPSQLVGKIKVIPASLSRALFPKLSATTDPSEAQCEARTALNNLSLVLTPVITFGILLLQPFMSLWVGHKLAAIASPLGEIILLGIWANGLAHIPYFYLQSKGRPDILAKVYTVELVPFFLALWGAMHLWGLVGAAIVVATRSVIDSCFIFNFAGLHEIRRYLTGAPAGIIISAIIGAHFVSTAQWYWRVLLIVFYFIGTGSWAIREKNRIVSGEIHSTIGIDSERQNNE